DLLWRHLLVPGLVVAVLPPVLVSATLISEVDLDRYRRSAMGSYVRRYMPPWVQALRLFGAAFAFYAAWYHVPAGVAGGLAIVGRSRVYRTAPASRATREMRSVIQRTLGVEARLLQALADLPRIQEASIFGSYAAGTERVGSDVDLLVVGSPPSDELRRRIGRVGRDLRRDVNLVELTSAELRKLRARRDPFISDSLSAPRVVLIARPQASS